MNEALNKLKKNETVDLIDLLELINLYKITHLYYTDKTKYSPYSGEELRAAAKAEATKEDFQSLTSGDGSFTISYTNLEPGQSYSCIMVAENENLDVSGALS